MNAATWLTIVGILAVVVGLVIACAVESGRHDDDLGFP